MTTVAILSNAVSRSGARPFRRGYEGHGPAYWHLIRIGRRFGLDFVLARREDWRGRLILRRAFTHDSRRWRVRRAVAFAAILPRLPLRVRLAPPVVYWNDPRVWKVCADKWLTYRRFRQVSPRTWRVTTPVALSRLRRRLPGRPFILKPRFGRQARGVRVLRPGQPGPARFAEPMIVQELIGGGRFQGREGVWDIRCHVQDGRLDLTYLKRGRPGDVILNVHRGSPIIRFPVVRLPGSARVFVRGIDAAFRSIRPRHYCIDFRYDEFGRPRLIELNHLPVLAWGPGRDYARFYEHLCRLVQAELAGTRRG